MSKLIGPGFLAVLTIATVLVSGGQASASHVACGDVITQDTTLDSDLIDCPQAGIVIGADGITLDLAGHAVDGDGVPDPIGSGCRAGIANSRCAPFDTGHDDVTVTGGTIREFETGVSIRRSEGVVIEQTRFEGNDTAVGLNDVTRPTVERNTFFRNSGRAIEGVEAHLARIERNQVAANGDGIRLVSARDGTIARNVIRDSALMGITVEDGAMRNGVLANRVQGNGHAGIVVVEGTRLNRVERNYVSNNGNAPGFHFFDGGILVDKDTRVERNSVSHNSRGIVLWGHGQNTVAGNAVTASVGDGILVEFGSDDPARPHNVLNDNVVARNGDDGIDVEDPRTVVSANTAKHNSDLGIEAVPGVTDGGGNRAFSNGNPLQCLNVFCR